MRKKTASIFSKIRNESGYLLSLLLFEFLSRAVRHEKEIKGLQK
jgi:hypothetical protein